jgi:hypothetical protein
VAGVKKRKVDDENHTFQSRWTEECLFIYIKGAAVCLICNETVFILKERDTMKQRIHQN